MISTIERYIILFTIIYRHNTTPFPLGIWNRQQRKMFLMFVFVMQCKEPCNGLLYQPICIQWAGPRSVQTHCSQVSWHPPGIIPCWMSVGVVLTVLGVYPSCSAAQSVFPLLSVYRHPLCHTAGRDCLQVAFTVGAMEPLRKEAKDNPSASANLLSKIFFW